MLSVSCELKLPILLGDKKLFCFYEDGVICMPLGKMIDLADINTQCITLCNHHHTLTKSGAISQVLDLRFKEKLLLIPKSSVTVTEHRKNGYHYLRIRPNGKTLGMIKLIGKWFNCHVLGEQDSIYFPYKKFTPFHILHLSGVTYEPTSAGGIHYLNQCTSIYKMKYMKEVVYEQLLLLTELLPVEVRCEILRQYIRLL